MDVPGAVFACNFSDDPDPLARACAPTQPGRVKVGQRWMNLGTGNTYPVLSVEPCRSRRCLVTLGSASLRISMHEPALRRDYVCVEAPDNVDPIEAKP